MTGKRTQAKHVSEVWPLISDQIDRQQLAVILHELEGVIEHAVSGQVVEFGCYIGTTSLFIRRLLNAYKDDRAFHVYDSFAGLPEKSIQDSSPSGTQFKAGELRVSKKRLLHEFYKANLQPPIIHKGWFKDLAPIDVPQHIAFAFLDGDFYESICDSLKLVLPTMQPGSVIIIDDYAREALPGVAKAVQDVAPELAKKVIVRHNLGIIHL